MLSTYGGTDEPHPWFLKPRDHSAGVTDGLGRRQPARHTGFSRLTKWTDGLRLASPHTTVCRRTTLQLLRLIRMVNGRAVMVAGAGDGFVYGMQLGQEKSFGKSDLAPGITPTAGGRFDDGRVYLGHGEENPRVPGH